MTLLNSRSTLNLTPRKMTELVLGISRSQECQLLRNLSCTICSKTLFRLLLKLTKMPRELNLISSMDRDREAQVPLPSINGREVWGEQDHLHALRLKTPVKRPQRPCFSSTSTSKATRSTHFLSEQRSKMLNW